ncbi:hypothetical protein RB623_10460 [Mesorhizobium sp. LHD-90]|uniref:hypothetical protein n=1 Tax=Mesorhizobium sp. LHD-90 TaxID=3071414 RepID=UPI0027E0A564|nr:hypothetical protein [Mesorhizobium sp. LHD-90]MDQ6434470.1 hypothetical protein [Mesorhizobium sp. LHD-90]
MAGQRYFRPICLEDSAMKRARTILATVSIVALSALPFGLDFGSLGSIGPSSAYAKDNGGGKGGGGGNGNGNGRGKSDSAKPDKGRSASARGSSGSLFGKDRNRTISRLDDKGRSKAKSTKAIGRARVQQVATVPAFAPVPGPKPAAKEKNFRAKLAGLNSLNRNYRAYLNSQSPRMAAMRAYVMASAELDIAREKVETANAQLATAREDFETIVERVDPVPYDDAVGIYDDPSLAELKDRLDHLNSVEVAPEDETALDAEIADLESILGSPEADSLADASADAIDARAAAAAASVGTDDETLREALLAAANKNRVAQYGEDYVDDEMMDWAKDLLGVGDDFGKIDEVRESLEASR